MALKLRHRLYQLLRSLELPAPEKALRLERIKAIERNIVLPLKAVAVSLIIYSLQFTPWFGIPLGSLEVTVTTVNTLFAVYVGVNLLGAAALLLADHVSFTLVQWSVFALSLIDGIFFGALTLVSGGYDSPLFWLFVVLIVRNAASMPPLWSQLTLNLCISSCFAAASFLAVGLNAQIEDELYGRQFSRPPTNSIVATANQENEFQIHDSVLTEDEGDTEAIVIRWLTLGLAAVWLYALQVLLEKQRLAAEEQREFNLRENQIRSAGRMAAEFAHQIKNPLAIVNNAAFSLERSLKSGKGNPGTHLHIIKEEVERADRIITQVMGYAELTEGRVEKLDLKAEVQTAVSSVFPQILVPDITVKVDLRGPFPPMLMQRRHLMEIFVNLLQNAREAMDSKGNVVISGRVRPDLAAEVSVSDTGPGIAQESLPRIFEAYFTTKSRGTGLGLSIVKNNMELYGGTVRAESELGKGTCFTLVFPSKAALHLRP